MENCWRYLFLFLCLLTGCVESIDLSDIDGNEPKLVFDGILSNEEPPYLFRLTKTASLSDTNIKGVTDALIVISDSKGTKDTLEWIDPLFFPEGGDANSYYGLYCTTKIAGKEGETYHLQICYENLVYEATEKMPRATQIDSLWFSRKQLEGKDEMVACPFINFRNALDEENFYMFTYSPHKQDDWSYLENLIANSMRVFPYSILKDTHLPEYVKEFNLNDGESVFGSEEGFHFQFSERDTSSILLYSITSSTYNFYEDLIKQMRYDGGTFTPSPTSARGNISNGALGLFRVNAVSRKEGVATF